MYAQTISYGLLTAKISRPAGLVADNIADMIPVTNPFLKELLQTFLVVGGRGNLIDFDELGINDVVEMLRKADMEAVLRDFGDRNPNEDPAIHFYELFLTEYDPEKRMKRGVFYTPRPVVTFIVRSVHEILQKEFGLADGLADTTTWGEMKARNNDLEIPKGVKETAPFVQILDPATGTGTFLVEVINTIYETLQVKWQSEGKSKSAQAEAWNDYVPKNLLPRLYGFELMMAPYSIAHMKIGLKLTETGYKFYSSERAQIYLTNTLEEAKEIQPYFETMSPALAHEAQAANRVKERTPITVVVGNPPYSNYSANLSTEARKIVDKYRTFQGVKIRERNQLQFERNLQDDFVKFIAYGEEKIILCNTGIMMMITNGTFLNSNSLRGVREHLSNTFNLFWELHLHGGTNERFDSNQTDQNVFDIEQMVAIHFYSKSLRHKDKRFMFAEIIGEREYKYSKLQKEKLDSDYFQQFSPDENNCSFAPKSLNAEDNLIPIDEIFIQFGAGIKTNRDSVVIGFDEKSLSLQLENEKIGLSSNKSSIKRILYRPFDLRFIFYHKDYVASRSYPTMKHMIEMSNIGIIASRTWTSPQLFSVGISKNLVEMKTGTHDRGTTFFPIYRIDDVMGNKTISMNLKVEFIKIWEKETNTRFIGKGSGNLTNSSGAEDILHWAYACFHSPKYRERNIGDLAQGFPLVPLTTNQELLRQLCALGEQLVKLHLLESVHAPTDWKLHQNGAAMLQNTTVASGFPKKELFDVDENGKGRVYINKSTYFDCVSEPVFNFHIGGYQVCHKWLKDRKDRELSAEDINHYGKITVALAGTIRLMYEIDETIETHGGFPLVGGQKK